jgi:hypothetical protein
LTQQQAVRIACRVVTVYLTLWAVSDLTNLPRELVSVLYEWHARHQPAPHPVLFYLQSALLFMTANLLRIALWSALALWFYRCPHRIQRFFGAETSLEAVSGEADQGGQDDKVRS